MLLSLPVHPSCSASSSRPASLNIHRPAGSFQRLREQGRSCQRAASLEGPRHALHLPGWKARRPSVTVHVAAPFPHELLRHPPASVDPAPMSGVDQHLVRTITSPAEFQQCLERHSGKLVVLMCKARSCRPCKAFAKRYQTLAKTYPDAVFLDVCGDDTMDLRGMMMKMQIKATPTFRLFRAREQVGSQTGANANKLADAIVANLRPGEAGFVAQQPEPVAAAAAESS